MFEETLLDSSRRLSPVLVRAHWSIAAAVGIVTAAGAYVFLPLAGLRPEPRVLLAGAATVGAVFFLEALMLAYVVADARRLGLRAWLWLAAALALNVAGFLVYLIYAARRTGDWRRASLPLAYLLETVAVTALVIVPLISTQALPRLMLTSETVLPRPPAGSARSSAPARVKPVPRVREQDASVTPVRIPDRIARVVERSEPATEDMGPYVIGGVPRGSGFGGPDPVIGGFGQGFNTPPPPPSPRPQQVRRIPIGGVVEAAKLIYGPKPDYPRFAIMAHVEGTVRLHAVIARDGAIQELHVLSGSPLLVNAAREAVARWRYQPTMLDGEPVEVETEIDVTFSLAR